ncbi:hypothetical protein PAMP_002054 [Pampus punctatissimus]
MTHHQSTQPRLLTFLSGGCSGVGHFQAGFPPQLSGSPADLKKEACHELTFSWRAQGVHLAFDVFVQQGCIKPPQLDALTMWTRDRKREEKLGSNLQFLHQ